MQTGWPCGGLSQNCPATLCAVSLAPSPAFRPTLKRRAYSAKPLRGSETARRPRPRGPSARGGFAQSARWFTIGLNRMPPTRLGHPPPSGRFDKSPLSEYTLSAPFQVTIQASSPHPRRLRRQRRSRWGRGEAEQLPFQNKNALSGDHSTDRGPVSTPARVARRSPIAYHKRRLPSSPGGPLFRSMCPARKEHRWIPIQGTRGPSGISPSSCYPTRASSPVFLPPVPVFPGGGPPAAPDS
jgi:hypothetical protein